MTEARRFLDSGDRTHALEAVDAVLAIDPGFVAAHSLRHRILSPVTDSATTPAPPEPQTDATSSAPFASVNGYIKFEERVKRRRLERQLDAARAAIEERQPNQAAAALDEVIELNPDEPELSTLVAALDNLRRPTSRGRRGPGLAAAAIFAGMMLAASRMDDLSAPYLSPVVSVSEVAIVLSPPSRARTAETDDEEDVVEPPARTERVAVARPAFRAVPPSVAPATPLPTPSPAAENLAPLNPLPPSDTSDVAKLTVTDSAMISPKESMPSANDELPVERALRRYRVAYDGLDARSAQSVWPSVNQAALARAFDGLESQTLTFEDCDVQLSGETATARCRGNMRYVPKIGSREPRTEPRVWSFTLRKSGSDWQIDNARVER